MSVPQVAAANALSDSRVMRTIQLPVTGNDEADAISAIRFLLQDLPIGVSYRILQYLTNTFEDLIRDQERQWNLSKATISPFSLTDKTEPLPMPPVWPYSTTSGGTTCASGKLPTVGKGPLSSALDSLISNSKGFVK